MNININCLCLSSVRYTLSTTTHFPPYSSLKKNTKQKPKPLITCCYMRLNQNGELGGDYNIAQSCQTSLLDIEVLPK